VGKRERFSQQHRKGIKKIKKKKSFSQGQGNDFQNTIWAVGKNKGYFAHQILRTIGPVYRVSEKKVRTSGEMSLHLVLLSIGLERGRKNFGPSES